VAECGDACSGNALRSGEPSERHRDRFVDLEVVDVVFVVVWPHYREPGLCRPFGSEILVEKHG